MEMNLKLKYHVGRFVAYFRRSKRDQCSQLDKNDTECHIFVDENMQTVDMYSHECLWDIQDHPIVKEWRVCLMSMNRDLSALFANCGENGFMYRMGLNNSASELEKWNTACTMGISVEFRDEFTTLLHMNVTRYVRTRVSYVLSCLCKIRGPALQYVQYTYVDPWKTIVGPDHVF
jgi:hypothetical protein